MADCCLTILIQGRVQGVGFRYYTMAEAERLAVRGWVRNLPDGRVEACICGTPAQVQAMQAWLNHGPALARVDLVQITPCNAPCPDNFTIRD